MNALKITSLAALFMALGFNISCGKSEFQADDNAQAQETGDNTVDTDVDGVDDGTSNPTNTNCTNNTTGTYNQNCTQTNSQNCTQTYNQNCTSNFPTNTTFNMVPTYQTNNVFVQQVPVQEIVVREVWGASSPVVQFVQPIVYNSQVYEIVPTDCFSAGNGFTTVYQAGAYGPQIQVIGTMVNRQIQAQVFYVGQSGSRSVLTNNVVYRRW